MQTLLINDTNFSVSAKKQVFMIFLSVSTQTELGIIISSTNTSTSSNSEVALVVLTRYSQYSTSILTSIQKIFISYENTFEEANTSF